MSETRDKRRKSDLDLFVLALIDSNVATPYALQKEAGLSPGATIPAIQRLAKAGSIRQGKPGPRGRTDYRITAVGKKQLKSGWRSLINEGPSGDLDADLRIALLAISEGNAYSVAAELIERSAAKLREMSETVSTENESGKPGLAGLYCSLRSISVRTLLEAQATAAATIGASLPRRLTKMSKQASSPASKKRSPRRIKRLE